MKENLKQTVLYIFKNRLILLLLLIGSFINISLYIPIKGNMGHDVYWHLALVHSAFDKFPFRMPDFAGAGLQGYNFLIDYIMYILTKIGIPATASYFIIFPFLYVLLMSLLTVGFGLAYKRSKTYIISLIFFVFYASPFAYILSLIRRNSLFYGYNYPTAPQSVSVLSNLQFALSLPIFITVFILIKRKSTLRNILLFGTLLFIAMGLKFYGGFLLAFFIGTFELIEFIKFKDFKRLLVNGLVLFIFSVFL